MIESLLEWGDSMSLPARGVWIEIGQLTTVLYVPSRHSPRGECGLKFDDDGNLSDVILSLPARGVWIEMSRSRSLTRSVSVTPREGSVD